MLLSSGEQGQDYKDKAGGAPGLESSGMTKTRRFRFWLTPTLVHSSAFVAIEAGLNWTTSSFVTDLTPSCYVLHFPSVRC